MDRISKYFTLILIMTVMIYSGCASENKIIQRFERTENELSGIDLDRLFDGQKDDASDEDFDYVCNISKKIDGYLKGLTPIDENTYKSLAGNYKLTDINGDFIRNEGASFLADYVSIFNVYKNYLSFQSQSSTTIIYSDKDDHLYFKARSLDAICQIIFIDNRMYVYILDGDYWKLEPIHAGGEFYYTKVNSSGFVEY